MEWIRCSERMPEDGVYVIVATVDTTWVETHFVESESFTGVRMWYSANEDTEPRPLQSFTHWMPLPPPPTE